MMHAWMGAQCWGVDFRRNVVGFVKKKLSLS